VTPVYSGVTNQVPATWYEATAGIRRLASPRATAPPTRGRRRVFGPVDCSARCTNGAQESSFGRPQQPFGLVDRSDHVIALGTDVALGEVADAATVLLHVVGDGGQLGGGGRIGGGHVAHGTGPVEPTGPHSGAVARLRRVIGIRDDLRALEGYHSAQLDVAVRLNTNESPQPPPAAFRDAVAAEVSRVEWHRYPDRAATELREAIADFHAVDPTQVFAANGSNEVLQTLLLAYAGPGRIVATFEPTYQMHAQIARVTGATVVEGERAPDFTLDPAEVERVLSTHEPDVVFLTSPNNPTGLVEPVARVRQLLDSAPGLVVIDEAYAQFADHSALPFIDEDRPLVVTRTYSKTWSMAGARLGYLIGPTWLVAELDKVVLPYHLDAVKQIAGRLALRFIDEMDARVKQLVAERERLSAELAEMPVDVVPSGANFILFRPRSLPGRTVWQQLVERDVLIRDCSSWPRLDGCLRVTVGTPDENDAFLGALSEVLAR
jgi:histidinol-phosphate aminotransferase